MVYKLKESGPGQSDVKYKARLVAKGFTQIEGVDCNEIYSPVFKHASIRIMLALITQLDLELEHLDVKNRISSMET